MDGMENSLNQRVDAVQEETTRTRLLLENEISRKIDIIGEGHDFLKLTLPDTRNSKSRHSFT